MSAIFGDWGLADEAISVKTNDMPTFSPIAIAQSGAVDAAVDRLVTALLREFPGLTVKEFSALAVAAYRRMAERVIGAALDSEIAAHDRGGDGD